MTDNTFEIDKITIDDLSINEMFESLNYCETSSGEDYLYNKITHPYTRACIEFDEFRMLMNYVGIRFDNNDGAGNNALEEKNTASVLSYLRYVGKLKKYKFIPTLNEMMESDKESNVKHYIIDVLIILSFILIFITPGPGVVAFLVLVAYSVSDYFKTKDIVAGKLYVFSYLIKMLKGKLPLAEDEILGKRLQRINEIKKKFRPFMAGTFLISESARTTSNPLGIVFDYLRMIFHVDIIKYNSMILFLKENVDCAIELYNIIGEIDGALSIRNAIEKSYADKTICRAELGSCDCLMAEGLYHPMLKEAVTNNVSCIKNMLITGCNASGKSTFLKSVALNSILAQSFGFAFADSFKAPYYRIYSSMALKDDIDAGESYFMAEIKSLKRILKDTVNNGRVLCVIDEVLRGTNTIERIAASTEILSSLCKSNVLCLAATHDIELTELLCDKYENYHFSEEITDNDVKFSYRIINGPASSRNAIRLLSLLGYDESLVESARKRADKFVDTGLWN